MFTPDSFIEAYQNTKRVFVNTVVTDKVIKQSVLDLIDAQTAFAKTVSQNAIYLAKYSTDAYASVLFPKKA